MLLIVLLVFRTRRDARTERYQAFAPRRSHRQHLDMVQSTPPGQQPRRMVVVVNPTKLTDPAATYRHIRDLCDAHGWAEPVIEQTSPDDPGHRQARAAAASDADVICALGGDGTIRAVASGLAGSRIPLGLLPAGTGNLLARNLGLPIDDLDRALTIAMTGHSKTIDIGRATIDRAEHDQDPIDETFLVMAGIGFDAAVMAAAPEGLKKRMGIIAYVMAGFRNMLGPQFKARITVDGGTSFTRRSRTVLIGNCGRIFGGLALMPDAKVDDGRLDSVIFSPKGIVGWTAVLARVVSRRRGGHPIVDHRTGQAFAVTLDRPEQVQLDGDLMGQATEIRARVEPGSLTVRVAPSPFSSSPFSMS